MRILSIETSCDETAIALIEASGDLHAPEFRVIANNLLSQADIHKDFGGVYPNIAKREHARVIVTLLVRTLSDANLIQEGSHSFEEETLREILVREPGVTEELIQFLNTTQKPDIDAIAVTAGPGLEPALWVGITFAQALGITWQLPLIPVNHMEGHVLSSLLRTQENKTLDLHSVSFPALALLISGGHTELVLIEEFGSYRILGETHDDAVGEAFDKVARILGLPYPGGPEISRLAAEGNVDEAIKLPRPMIHTHDYNFSFSGLKTAVLYLTQKYEHLSEQNKKDIAKEFETAVADVLVKKLKHAIDEYGASFVFIGGGVAANTYLRRRLQEELPAHLLFPDQNLSTDNAIMIGMAGYIRFLKGETKNSPEDIRAVRAASRLVLPL